MARPRRSWHADGYYHVTVRGNNRQNIFYHDRDVNEYFRILDYTYQKYHFQMFAYCIMSNHVHFLLSSPIVHLSKIMAIINKRYSDYFRTKYHYTGQIYENRYFSEELTHPVSLLNVGAYIHRNPIETKTPLVTAMEQYAYSSYKFYYNNLKSPYPFLCLNSLPKLLPNKRGRTPYQYALYCLEYNNKEKLDAWYRDYSIDLVH